MVLRAVLRDLMQRGGTSPAQDESTPAGPRVLNVGGGSKQIPIPAHYNAWEHVLLDIDPSGGADVVCDARQLTTLRSGQFDAVYCSHNLEHYYRHDVARVLQGFLHVLKADGFAEIRVPDINAVMSRVVSTGMDMEDVLYQSPAGPISVSDVVYGYGKQIEQTGNDFYAHKTGFTARSLTAALRGVGFDPIYLIERPEDFELHALALRAAPTSAQRALLGL
jgi:SAM-dependent methyltransferase